MRKAIAVYATATKKRERKENRKKGEKATKLETKIWRLETGIVN